MADVAIDERLNLDSLRQEVRDPVRAMATRLLQDLGGNVKSLSVVGSALTGDFHPRQSDINTVLVLQAVDINVLKVLAGYGPDLGVRKLHAPFLMTEEYLRRSLDVFGVEFLDFQLNHAVVVGIDPFAAAEFHKECIRLQCERELRSAQIKLWEGYIRQLGSPKAVEELLSACVKKLLPVMRAMLWLVDHPRPKENRPTLESTAKVFSFNGAFVDTMLRLRDPGQYPARRQANLVFLEVYNVVEYLGRSVDQLGGRT